MVGLYYYFACYLTYRWTVQWKLGGLSQFLLIMLILKSILLLIMNLLSTLILTALKI